METIAIFADVQNIYYTTRQAYERQFDYRSFLDFVSKDRKIVAATAYAIEPKDGKQKGFQQILKDLGFSVKLKPYIQRQDGSAKADWDVGIALDMYEQSQFVNTSILVSGDGDFDLAVERIREKFATRVEVYGVKPLTAQSLINAANAFHEIDDQFLLQR